MKFLKGEVEFTSDTTTFYHVGESQVLKTYFTKTKQEIQDEEYIVLPDIKELTMDLLGGLCGCGNPDIIQDELLPLLRYFHQRRGKTGLEFFKLRETVPQEMMSELLWKFLDNEGLLEHGGSIGGSWLSPLGKELLQLLELFEHQLSRP